MQALTLSRHSWSGWSPNNLVSLRKNSVLFQGLLNFKTEIGVQRSVPTTDSKVVVQIGRLIVGVVFQYPCVVETVESPDQDRYNNKLILFQLKNQRVVLCT